jgi:SHS2 domain-containing protein
MSAPHLAEHPVRHYDYFDHDADVGIVGRGPSVEAAFAAGAAAMFDLMCDITAVRPRERVEIDFEETDLEFAFVTWLNFLLARAHELGLALGRFELHRDGAHWRGAGFGEPWHDGLTRGVGVKGATLTMLSVSRRDSHWEARCVVDV